MLSELAHLLGKGGLLPESADHDRYLTEWRGRAHGVALAVARPATTAEVVAIVQLCARHSVAIVPQGGNTGLCGGAIPDESGEQLVVSLERMKAVRAIDADDDSMIVEAGCTLTEVQALAREAGRYFPLSLAAEGSATIGGAVSTDAGGINVLRYGTARAQVLGMEVVLPSGDVWNGLRCLRKNTAGFDLKQLFVGAEGKLGIVTAVALGMRPRNRASTTAFLALNNATDAVATLALVRDELGESVSAFEYLSRRSLDFVLRHIDRVSDPFDQVYPAYVLAEVAFGGNLDPTEGLQNALARAQSDGLIHSAILATSERQVEKFWRIRHSVSSAQKSEGASLKHDIAVPRSCIARFVSLADERVTEILPGVRPVTFGHIGDGNVHYNLSIPRGMAPAGFEACAHQLSGAVYELVGEFNGSISAEHGIGQFKLDEFRRRTPAVELNLMQRLKTALDPENIMNPGKVI